MQDVWEPVQLDYHSGTGVAVQLVHISLHSVLEEESCLLTALKEQRSHLLFFYA